jgi:hypothetical protein
VAAEAEIAATAAVGVVGEEWADAVGDEAVVVRRPRRRDESEALRLFLHENDSPKRYPVCDTVFIWEGCFFLCFSMGRVYLCCFIASGDNIDAANSFSLSWKQRPRVRLSQARVSERSRPCKVL